MVKSLTSFTKALIDTDVLIDYLRNQEQAVRFLETIQYECFISAITIAELYAGARENEHKTLKEFINLFNAVPITSEIAMQGGQYKKDYYNSHGTGLADAVIAASSHACNSILVTLNKRHFPMLQNVLVPYKKA